MLTRFIEYSLILFVGEFLIPVRPWAIPDVRFEIFTPKGLQVSIPALQDISSFHFHGARNRELRGTQQGDWNGWIHKPENGRFRYRNESAVLEIGDVIHYWVYAIFEGGGYREHNKAFTVLNYASPTTSGDGLSSDTFDPNCKSTPTVVNGQKFACGQQIIFQDRFNDNVLDSNKWFQEHRFPSEPDFEFNMYATGQAILRDGYLQLKPKLTNELYGSGILRSNISLGEACTGKPNTEECIRISNSAEIIPPVITSQINTKKSFSFKYGTVLMRAKLPNSPWTFPQIFLNPLNSVYGKDDYRSGQIRVAFLRGGRPCELIGGVVFGTEEPFRSFKTCTKMCTENEDWSAGLHLYKIVWTPVSIILYADDVEYCRIDVDNGFAGLKPNGVALPGAEQYLQSEPNAPFDQEFYITLGYGIGGHYDFPNDNDMWRIPKPWKNKDPRGMSKFWRSIEWDSAWPSSDGTFMVDFIRVFSL